MLSPTNKNAGFALVIALGLMAFVVLLLLSITALVRVEGRSSQQGLLQLEARQNARLGAIIALGDLQRYAGSDQRMTGRGEVLVRALDETADALDAGADARAWWSGVARTDGAAGTLEAGVLPDVPGSQQVHWLVSGLEGPAAGTLPPPSERVTFYEADAFRITVTDGSGNVTETASPALEAGWVEVGASRGRFAFFVEDEGVKGTLASEAGSNLGPLFAGGALLPGNFDPGDLAALPGFADPDERIGQTRRLGDLAVLGVSEADLEKHRMNYTLGSYGVLSSARVGGLRVDLSNAFEDNSAFNSLFNNGDQLLLTEERAVEAADLVNNDWINWKIFRDYYGLKDRIDSSGRVSASLMRTNGFPGMRGNDYREGFGGNFSGPLSNGPHGFERHTRNLHYVFHDGTNTRSDNPLKPILAYFYYEMWADLSFSGGAEGEPPTHYEARLFLRPWLAFYNPYNVTLRTSQLVFQPDFNAALRIIDDGGRSLFVDNSRIEGDWRFVHSFSGPGGGSGAGEDDIEFYSMADEYLLAPGETRILTMNVAESTAQFRAILTDDFDNVTAAGFQRVLSAEIPPGFDTDSLINVEVQSYRSDQNPRATLNPNNNEGRPYFLTGRRLTSGQPFQPYQWMIFPLAYDPVQTGSNAALQPGKRVLIEDITLGSAPGTNANNAARFGMWLRGSGESVDQLRPLIDGNIRAAIINPRWDVDAANPSNTGLGLRTPVSYSGAPYRLANKGAINSGGGIGHSLWGIYDAESGNPTAPGVFPFTNTATGKMRGLYGRSLHESFSERASLRVPLFDIPREPLVSLGQFQHAEAGHFSYEPSYIVGNSYANPRIPLNDWRNASARDTFSDWDGLGRFKIPGTFNLYDASYLVNEHLWDDYVFTTLPFNAGAGVYEALLSGGDRLPNRRYRIHQPEGLPFNTATINATGPAARRNAGFILSEGSFNVNSTSVEAWEAFLSSTRGLPVVRVQEDGRPESGVWAPTGARFPRLASQIGESGFWDGFDELDASQIRSLAVAIVEEVRIRGPFKTLGQFINRWDVENDSIPASDNRRKAGALQAALDRTVNAGIAGSNQSAEADSASFPAIHPDSPQAAGFPGHILQGDLLQSLSPYMNVRSDTFKIRSVGQVRNPLLGDTPQAEVWCEMIVQRLPDPVMDPDNPADIEQQLIEPSAPFGRRFAIIDFRWIEKESL